MYAAAVFWATADAGNGLSESVGLKGRVLDSSVTALVLSLLL